jgi:hypothetical protein
MSSISRAMPEPFSSSLDNDVKMKLQQHSVDYSTFDLNVIEHVVKSGLSKKRLDREPFDR